MWSRFLVDLLRHRPDNTYVRSVEVMEPLRSRKDAAEIAALQAAGAAADRVAAQLHGGQIPLVGRTEAEVSADISARLIAEGHQKVNFAIVAAGENAASPHHHAGDRIIRYGEIVLCDFGGTMNGYCSDITRCVHLGPPPQDIADGNSCESVDAVTRAIIDEAGYGEYFVHRTGHGIGMEEHEDPYMVAGNGTSIASGHAYSVEPGIYVPGKWGMRLEDIVVVTENGPLAVNNADHNLIVLER
jgi:Xaa-Pro aminopeptidase